MSSISSAKPFSDDKLIQACASPRGKVIATGANGLAIAHSLARLLEVRQPILAVVADVAAADSLLRDLRFLLKQGDKAKKRQVLSLTAEHRTPYSSGSPALEVTGERLATLLAIASGRCPDLIVVPGFALMQRTLELEKLQNASLLLQPGDEVGRDPLAAALERCGYTRVPLVEDPTTYAVRGSVIDIFVPGVKLPVRVDLFGDEIDSLKSFDPTTQRTRQKLKSFALSPIRELLFDPDAVASARHCLRELADEMDFPTRKVLALINDIENAVPFFGIEALTPAFSQQPRPWLGGLLQEMLGEQLNTVLVDSGAVYDTMANHWGKMQEGYHDARARKRLSFPPELHAEAPEQAFAVIKQGCKLSLDPLVVEERGATVVSVHSSATSELTREIEKIAKSAADGEAPEDLFEPVRKRLESLRRQKICTLVLVRGNSGIRRMSALLEDHQLKCQVVPALPDLLDKNTGPSLFRDKVHAHLCAVETLPWAGTILPDWSLAIFTEEDFFGRRARRRTSSTKSPFRTALADLEDGNVVVHTDFGIGIYRGLTRLNLRGVEADYLLITYRDDDKLYLPVTRINLVQRYSGNEDHRPRLDKLGGQTWTKTKTRVKKAILAMAQELLSLYARRELSEGHAFPAPDPLYHEFEGGFPFEETPDQEKAINDVLADMQRKKTMDRLVCGDVGYGKTEVAMRATMLAVLGGKQAALLSPTTVLAQQHYLTFCERFRNLPLTIEVISRLRKTAEVTRILQRVKQGEVDVLIGTHRLLSHDVGFKDLGLLVVDEEHRFGVKDKERIKRLRTSVDVLALSATPIPRTLQMSFFGIRDLSVIDTPPADRRAIRTVITRFEERTIVDAIERELGRGGQVYFVHNRVRSIQPLAAYLRRILPNARIGVAHGQMAETALEKVMLTFIRGETNVLVTTTIIESGIDIPNANTILINRADMLGLAQLYQLRGRVGRSHQRAFAYLLVPAATDRLTPKARKRLEVLQKFAELGAGFKIAQHDLELRGAGDLLGKNQHGHVAAVGYEMYAELLGDAVRDLKGQSSQMAPEPELNVHVAAFIPDSYVLDVQERLSFYQRMATAIDSHEVYEVLSALEDRYGKVPTEARTLAEVMVLKVMLKELAARAIDLVAPKEGSSDPARVVVSLGDSSRLDPAAVATWVAEQPQRVRITPQNKLYLTATAADWLAAGEDVVDLARRFLSEVKKKAYAADLK